MTHSESADDGSAARFALAVLTLINLLNYIDRFVVAALVESIRHSELHPTDTQLGTLITSFVIVYMLTSPIFGALGDRGRRPRLVAAGVAIWSVATALAGFARSYATLLASRAMVGVGEAAYATIAPALLADHFPAEKRGRVFAVFFAAVPIGAAAGYVLGGVIDHHFGWRAAFFVCGAPGILLALVAGRVKDPSRAAVGRIERGAPMWASFSGLLRNREYVETIAGYAAYTFALGALAFWMPAFLERIRGMQRQEATVTFGAISIVTGLVGTFGGGWLGDLALRRWRGGYLWVSGISSLAATPFAILAFEANSRPLYLTGVVGAELLLFASTGPVNSAIVSAVGPQQRASALALSILAIHLFGDVPSPPLVGMISDATTLLIAFRIIPVAIALSGIIWVLAALRLERSIGLPDQTR
jgi:MFS transporter, Spinster family, sphingosine-1-phosphate transporter